MQELEEEVSYSSSSEGSCSTELPNRSMGQLSSLFERAALQRKGAAALT